MTLALKRVVWLFRYLSLTVRHKAYVLRAGLWTGAPLSLLLIHDWTKLTRAEAPHYARQFFGDRADPIGFQRAWLHHQNTNPHHWEYWIPWSSHTRSDWPDKAPVPIPEPYLREMVADWFGVSQQLHGSYPDNVEAWEWWQTNKGRITLHPDTRVLLDRIIAETFARKNGERIELN